MFYVHNSYLWAQENHHITYEHCCEPLSVTGQAGSSKILQQSGRLLEDVPLAVRQKLWFQDDRAPAYHWEDIRAVVKHDISRKVDGMSRANCMAFSVIAKSDGFFPVGTSEGACSWSPSQDYRRSCGKTASSCDVHTLRHVPVNAVWYIAACLEMVEAHFEHLP
jgi:hypothetical protein